jgi:Zn-dependent alcohol dehydrogenase
MGHLSQVVLQEEPGAPLELHQIELPDPTGHQVLVEMISTGVCQSQLFWMSQPRTAPLLLGHEGYGRVLAVGEAVTRVAPQNEVLVTWIPGQDGDRAPIKSAATLSDGRDASCPNIYTWATRILIDDLYLAPVAAARRTLSYAVVGCAVATGAGSVRNLVRMDPGSTVGVIGLGGVGVAAVVAARINGASRIVGIDVDDKKLGFAKQFGLTDAFNSTRDDVGAEVGASGLDYVLDCVGSERTINDAIRLTKVGRLGFSSGGTTAWIGLPHAPVPVDGQALIAGERTLIGCYGGASQQSELAEYLAWHDSGEFDLDQFVTRAYALADVTNAVDDLRRGNLLGRAIIDFGLRSSGGTP